MSKKEDVQADRMELTVFSCWTAKLLLRAKIEAVNVDTHGKFITIDINDDITAKPLFHLCAPSEKQTNKWADDLRAACAYPFNPARKVSNKRRYEDCLEMVAKIAQEIQEWKP